MFTLALKESGSERCQAELDEASNDGLLMPFVRLLMISNIIDQVFSI